MSLKSTIRIMVEATQSSQADGGPRTAVYKYDTGEIRWTDGIGYDQADLAYSDVRTLSGSSETLDLSGVFTDGFGTVVSPAKIKALVVVNRSQSLALTLKSAASAGWAGQLTGTTDSINIPKASSQMYGSNTWIAPQGVAIAGGATDSITIGGTAGGAYEIHVIGTSA